MPSRRAIRPLRYVLLMNERRAFQVDAVSLKLETFAALAKTAPPPPAAKAFVEAVGNAIEEAIAADNFEAAKQFAAAGLGMAKRVKEAELIRQMVNRGKEVENLQAAFAGVNESLAALRRRPLDAEANLAVGRFRALIKGDWDGGIPYLALGGDARLKSAAVAELTAGDAAPEEQLKLADAWWDLAAASEPGIKERIETRALFWYSKVQPQLTGLVKLRVDKRLQEIVGRVFARVQTAQRTKKLNVTPAVGAPNRGNQFVDMADEGGLLIGFEVGLSHFNGDTIQSLRPIFLTPHGEANGARHGGNRQADVTTIKAREGYAVGGVTFKGTNRFEAVSVTFMQIQGAGLSSRGSYVSDWAGNQDAKGVVRMGGSGVLVVGVAGRADNALQSISLITVR